MHEGSVGVCVFIGVSIIYTERQVLGVREEKQRELGELYAPHYGNAITGKVSVRINMRFLLSLVVTLGGWGGGRRRPTKTRSLRRRKNAGS